MHSMIMHMLNVRVFMHAPILYTYNYRVYGKTGSIHGMMI